MRVLNYLRAAADPVRLSILEALEILGELSTADLSNLVVDARRSLTHHLRELEAAQQIEKVGPEVGRLTRWSLTANGPAVTWDETQASHPDLTAVARTLEQIATQRRIDRLRRWDADVRARKWDPELVEEAIGRDWVLRLSGEDLADLDQRIQAVLKSFQSRQRTVDDLSTGDAFPIFVSVNAFPFRLGGS